MTKKELLAAYPKDPFDAVIEEASEVTKEICKANRFGLYNTQKGDGTTNYQRIVAELDDLEEAIHNLRVFLGVYPE